jgi:hypothetical protein
VTTASRPGPRWLLLQAQLPAGRSTARVGVWRRLRKLEAVALGATWAVPDDEENRELCEWMRRDIEAAGGESMLFTAQPADAAAAATLARRRGGERAPAAAGGADPLAPLDRGRFRRRTWVTRPRPGVDRMASAWLIHRFVDPEAKFEFAADPLVRRARAVPFDAYGAELGHQAGLCTFEVLARRFGIADAAVARMGRTVRAVDLHEADADDAEAAMLERLVAGLRATHAEDHALLAAGVALFEALHASPSAPASPKRRGKRAAEPVRRKGRKR